MEQFSNSRKQPFDFLFDNGDLRKISIDREEIIQRIYYAVRDKEWLNIPYTLQNYTLCDEADKTACSYDLHFKSDSVGMVVRVVVSIHDNTLVIETDGKALADFKKNRIGLCVHIPAAMKGTLCEVTHPDGTKTGAQLPLPVSPHQPFKNISAIDWVSRNKKIAVSFEGDIFEMEDQRNWTDASYKIYSTPLELPFPVEVKKGDTFYQKITVSVSAADTTYASPEEAHEIHDNERIACPEIGILDLNNLQAIPATSSNSPGRMFSFARLDFRLHEKSWQNKVLPVIAKAKSLRIPLYGVLYLSDDFTSEITDFLRFMGDRETKPELHSIALLAATDFVLPDTITAKISEMLRASLPGVRIGKGTDANFAQLNRNRPNTDCVDFLCYSIQPQEHASDLLSITENIMGQYDTVKTAQSFAGGKEIDISALSLFRRFNANVDKIPPKDPITDDKHRNTAFETGWFIGALHQLALAGARAITCVAAMEKESPLYQLFSYMAEFPPENFYTEKSLDPEKYSLLSWQCNGKRYSVMANLTQEPVNIGHHALKQHLAPHEIRYIEHDPDLR